MQGNQCFVCVTCMPHLWYGNKCVLFLPWPGNMTVQMEIDIRQPPTLPVICSKFQWSSSLNDYEFPIATELVELNGVHSLKYTSLRDIMPPSPTNMGSPRREADWCSSNNICIKNHLVKHAALAYLQPMVTQSNNKGEFFTRCWEMFRNDGFMSASFKEYIKIPIEACIGFFTKYIFANLLKTFGYLAGWLGEILGGRSPKK